MLRRVAFVLTAVLGVTTALTSCGDEGSRADDTTTDIEFVPTSIVLSADRGDEATVLADETGSVSVAIPDSALPDGLTAEDITATVNRLTASDIGNVVEFALGPDGTEFDEPVTLTWTADWNPDGVVAISAIADDGTNLLDDSDDSDEILKTLQIVPNDDGTSTISVEIDHFSRWTFFHIDQAGFGVNVDKWTSGHVFLSSGEDYPDVGFSADIGSALNSYLPEAELCLDVQGVSLTGLSVTKGAEIMTSGLRQCILGEEGTYIDMTIELECSSSAPGQIIGTQTLTFGAPGLSPMDIFVLALAGSQPQGPDETFPPGAWASASEALIFVHRRFEHRIVCSSSTTTTTIPASTSSVLGATTSLPGSSPGSSSATTARPGQTGTATTTVSPVITTSPTATTTSTSTTTTTTAAPPTTARPRPGATTTLP